MNVSQALEYERQPFIPMFIYGDHGAMESERQKGEEALKVLETEYFTARRGRPQLRLCHRARPG